MRLVVPSEKKLASSITRTDLGTDQTEPSSGNELEQRVLKSAFATVHTHSNECD
jgi:hypothetical protein